MAIKMMFKKYLPKMILVWTAFFLLALPVYMFVLLPQARLQKRLNDQRSELFLQYQQVQEFAVEQNQGELNRQISDSRSQAEIFVVNPSSVSNLTFDISTLANQLKLSSVIVKPRGSQEIRNCNYIFENQFNISFNSSFTQFFSLLNSLERHKPVIFIDTFSITAPRQEQEGNEVKMDVSVFVLKASPTSMGKT